MADLAFGEYLFASRNVLGTCRSDHRQQADNRRSETSQPHFANPAGPENLMRMEVRNGTGTRRIAQQLDTGKGPGLNTAAAKRAALHS